MGFFIHFKMPMAILVTIESFDNIIALKKEIQVFQKTNKNWAQENSCGSKMSIWIKKLESWISQLEKSNLKP